VKDVLQEGAAIRLALEGISHAYDGVAVLHDVTLELARSEVTCLLGPSGCGKSTLLRIAAGVDRQDRGRVLVDGRVVSDGAAHLPPEVRQVGLMFQDFALFPHPRRTWPSGWAGRWPSAAPERRRCSSGWGSPGTGRSIPTSCRGASSSVWRWRGRWRRGRASS
jgi:hypothetical protein